MCLSHDTYTHAEDGRVCVLLENGRWFVPLDTGGEGFDCDRLHGSPTLLHHRPGWHDYFLGIADAVGARGECVRSQVACVLVRDNRIVATGYNGVAAGEPSCLDGACPRGASNVARRSEGGPGYDAAPCVAFHAEDNAVSDALARGLEVRGCAAYITKEPCLRCRGLLDALDLTVFWRDATRSVRGFRSAEGVWTTELITSGTPNNRI
jgi:dCMP deaminase